jgi:hypothetical protein
MQTPRQQPTNHARAKHESAHTHTHTRTHTSEHKRPRAPANPNTERVQKPKGGDNDAADATDAPAADANDDDGRPAGPQSINPGFGGEK